jgi:hypothetical protein
MMCLYSKSYTTFAYYYKLYDRPFRALVMDWSVFILRLTPEVIQISPLQGSEEQLFSVYPEVIKIYPFHGSGSGHNSMLCVIHELNSPILQRS